MTQSPGLLDPSPSPVAAAGTGTLVFEQPLNERMRTFLRLDFLYNQALHHNERSSPWGSRAAMASLIDILAIGTRGDVRSDVLKELESHLTVLNDFESKPGVDTQRLKALTANLVRHPNVVDVLSAARRPAALRDSEFVSAIRHRSAIPGAREFDLPDYYSGSRSPMRRGCAVSASGSAAAPAV
jgi:cell division protein ZapD